jgi:hypothetical protein
VGNAGQKACTKQPPHQPVHQRFWHQPRATAQADQRQGQNQRIGQQADPQIDGGEGQQKPAKSTAKHQHPPAKGNPGPGGKDQAANLQRGMHRVDAAAAMAAAPAQRQPAGQRHQFQGAQWRATAIAAGAPA